MQVFCGGAFANLHYDELYGIVMYASKLECRGFVILTPRYKD